LTFNRKGKREGGREGRREGGREGGRKGGREGRLTFHQGQRFLSSSSRGCFSSGKSLART